MPEPSEQDPTPTPQTPEVAPEAPTDAPPPQAAAPQEPKGAGKVIELPTDAVKKIKDEAKAKGRREAFEELEAAAVQAGFASVTDAFQALGDLKKQKAVPSTTPPQPQEPTIMPEPKKKPDPAAAKASAEAARHAEERARMHKQWRSSEKAKRRLQAELDAKEAQMALRDEFHAAGVKDVDFVSTLYARELAGKSAEEIAKHDRKAFVEKVKKDRPYLFGEVVAPATTGTNGAAADGSAPPAPPAGAPAAAAAAGQRFDARTATPQQVQEHMRKLGLNPTL